MKKHSLLTALLVSASVPLAAVPAKRDVRIIVPGNDGTPMELTLKGDEYSHWWEDGRGEAWLLDGDGDAVELSAASRGEIRARGAARKTSGNKLRGRRMAAAGKDRTKYTGTKRGLVILVNFADKEMTSSSARDDFDDMFNLKGYSENGHIGSVADYFSDQSYGRFGINFDVVGPVTVSRSYSYYGQNDRYGDDKYPCTMVTEACRLADEEEGTDFSLYDWNGDGEVDQVFIVYAGYGENYGASSNTIWPHEWTLSEGYEYGDGEGPLTIDGVRIDTYAVTCELSGRSGSTVSGIGTACHEFSHCLGYPDFYDTSYSGGWGMQAWDLLDSGAYNGPSGMGEVPSGYTSYERWQAGWLEPEVLASGTEVTGMQPLGTAPEAYILYNDADSDEYYLFEYRKSEGWFAYTDYYTAPSGLLVIHADYDETAWEENAPNDEASHQRMTIIQANNKKGTYSYGGYSITASEYGGHVYPYGANDSLTVYSVPAAELYNANTDGAKFMNKGIYGITADTDGTMSFSCRGRLSGEDESTGGDGGDGDSDAVFYESFDSCAGTGGNDGLWSGNIASGAFLPDNAGWTSEKEYGAYECARFGTGSSAGEAESPEFNLTGGGVLSFRAGIWDSPGEDTALSVYYGGDLVLSLEAEKGGWTDVSVQISGTGPAALTFAAGGRFFLDEVKVTPAGETDFITDAVTPGKAGGPVYSVSGQYVGTDTENLPSGVYIRNNRKILKK